MNRYLVRFLLLLALVPRGGVILGTDRSARVVAEDKETVTLDFAFPEPRFTWSGEGESFFAPGETGLVVSIEGCGLARLRPGLILPVLRERVAVPAGAEVALEILESGTRAISPAEAGVPAGLLAQIAGRARGNSPRDPVAKLGPEGYLRFQRFVPVEVRPVAWDEERRSFLYTSRLRVRVRWTEAPSFFDAGDRPSGLGESLFGSVYSSAFANGGTSGGLRSPEVFRSLPHRLAGLDPGRTAPLAPRLGPSPEPRGRLLDSRFKLTVTEEGVYRVRGQDLIAAGADLSGVDPATLKLLQRGREVAIRVFDGPPAGFLDAADWFEFYGVPLIDEATLDMDGDTIPDNGGVWESGDFTDINVYWLEAGGAPGLRMAEVDAAPGKGYPPVADFQATARAEANTFFHAKSLGPGITHWFYDTISGPTSPPFQVSVPLRGLNPASARAPRIRWEMLGRSELACPEDHRATLCVGGTDADCEAGTTQVDLATWDGLALADGDVAVSLASLSDPVVLRVHIPAPLICDPIDFQNPSWFEVDYPRGFVADGDYLRASVEGEWSMAIGGFTASSAGDYAAYDVTDTRLPRHLAGGTLSGAGPYTLTVEYGPADPADVRACAFASFPAGARLPDSIEEDVPSGLRDPGRGADVVLLTGPPLLGSQAIADYVAYRQATHPGIGIEVVDVREVYDEFSHGLLDPRGVQGFLRYALENWTPPPAVLLILGDGSIDTKDHLGADGSIVPPITRDNAFTNWFLGYYSTDNQLGAVLGADDLPDLYVGRLPARTPGDLQVMVDKAIGYESAPPAGPWRGHALLTADRPSTGTEVDGFIGTHDRIVRDFLLPPYTYRRLDYQDYGTDWQAFRTDMVNEINTAGVVINTFIGHGNFTSIGDDTLFSNFRAGSQPADVLLLQNGGTGPADPGRLPLVIHANCLTGGFMNPSLVGGLPLDALVESLLKEPGRGAWGAIAPLGLTQTYLVEDVVRPVFEGLFGVDKERVLGALVFRSLVALDARRADDEVRMTACFGDPLTRVTVPAPSKPLDLAAVPADGYVDLSWTPNPPGENATYRIWRNEVGPSAAFEVTGTSPTASFRDSNVANGTTYWYRVAAVDPDGYEGPRSEPVSALPCKQAPPPAPTGVFAEDTGDGTSLRLSWAALPPAEEVVFYTVRWGDTAGGPYPGARQSPSSWILLTGLQEGVQVYIVVTATNVCGLEGVPSQEIVATPQSERGMPVPAMIRGLRVYKELPADVRLEWDAVTEDTHGDPVTVAAYDVYRAPRPDFLLEPAWLAATITCPPCSGRMTWSDAGALTRPGNFHYLVVARDGSGETSGASNDLPRGIRDLRVSRPAAGTLDLTWTPVSLDLSGAPTLIQEYRTYGAGSPVLRSQVRAMTPLAGGTVPLPPATVAEVPGKMTFYSVIVVDLRGNLSPY